MIKLARRAGKPASATRRQNPSRRSSTDAPAQALLDDPSKEPGESSGDTASVG
jgi:hypothetical protein